LPKVLISYFFCPQGAQGPVRTLIEGIGREGCVSGARAKVEGGRPLCVGASYRGNDDDLLGSQLGKRMVPDLSCLARGDYGSCSAALSKFLDEVG
jgi:hypothetical protein